MTGKYDGSGAPEPVMKDPGAAAGILKGTDREVGAYRFFINNRGKNADFRF